MFQVIGFVWSFFITVGCIIALIIVGYLFFLLQQPISQDNVIVTGNRNVSRELVQNTVLANGSNFIEQDIFSLSELLSLHPWIEKTNIKYSFPASITLELQERQPVAFLKTAGGVYLLDRKGVLLPLTKNPDGWNLPVISHDSLHIAERFGHATENPSIIQALKLCEALKENNPIDAESVSIIDISDPFNINLILLERNLKISLGDSDFVDKLGRLRPFFAGNIDTKQLVSIDLRFADKVIVQRK